MNTTLLVAALVASGVAGAAVAALGFQNMAITKQREVIDQYADAVGEMEDEVAEYRQIKAAAELRRRDIAAQEQAAAAHEQLTRQAGRAKKGSNR